ncbi:hypothetical protein [Actinotalea sp. K2]|uniref:hypothetical protein n=1 Tax=Actinotalea sp. K2 TaxID=2939438 RepID=UPI002017BB81|nr:hypothetical protein [Actinotalea sp. K2]MCL3861568.1 hypothetical protein [Actinotalea sp. K2]
MILFFGTRVRRRVLGVGSFRCPFCLEPRRYEHLEQRTWFHLFWVLTLFPVGPPRESVRCSVCAGEWAPVVLQSQALD